jgi:hypothetical protein
MNVSAGTLADLFGRRFATLAILAANNGLAAARGGLRMPGDPCRPLSVSFSLRVKKSITT